MMYFVSFGAYLLMNQPLVKGRGMYCIGVMLSVIFLYIVDTCGVLFGKTCLITLCGMFFVFAFTYGNALYVQAE